jgi:hypothetical protein
MMLKPRVVTDVLEIMEAALLSLAPPHPDRALTRATRPPRARGEVTLAAMPDLSYAIALQ